jgi:rhodanese-related sulfurtransferase
MAAHNKLRKDRSTDLLNPEVSNELPSFSSSNSEEEPYEVTIQQFRGIFDNFDPNDNILLLDVREDEDMTHGVLPKFNRNGVSIHNIRIPILDLIELQTQAIDPYKHTHKILVYCRGGRNSIAAMRYLQLHGFNAQNIKGGMRSIEQSIYLWEDGRFYCFFASLNSQRLSQEFC